jgi:hypothetical protein
LKSSLQIFYGRHLIDCYDSTKLIQNKYTEYDKRWGKQKGVLWTIKNGKSRSTCKIGHYSQLEDKQNKKHAILHLFRFMLKRMENFIMHKNKFFYGGHVGISEIK